MKTPRFIMVGFWAALPFALAANPVTDRLIEDTAKSSHTFREVLDKKIDVKARDGVVTLTGKVADESQKRLAEDTVASVSGVTRIDNQIKVESTAREGSDEWLKLKIRSVLLGKANVSIKHTSVDVKNGIVTLTGTADSAAQKELTKAYVQEIEGVKAVQNHLQVLADPKGAAASDQSRATRESSPSPRMKTNPSLSGEKIDDGSITAQIKFELFSHRSTNAVTTKITTINGHVVVDGPAASEAEKGLVTKLAQSVRGVVDVENHMTVKK